jgi:prepilin-type N-terminal cleavage/methylation domain-containing protein
VENNGGRKRKKWFSLSDGFTVLELLIGISIFVLLLAACLQGIVLIRKDMDRMKMKLALQEEAAGFFHYFKKEAQCTNQYFVANHRIYFYHEENVLDYRQLGSQIIRQKNGEGYVIVCFDVKDFLLIPEQNGVLVQLVLERGEQQVEISALVEQQVQKLG